MTRRADLDAWFARAEDVLRDWSGSPDAMVGRAAPDDADPELPLLGDLGADQHWPLRRARPRQMSVLRRGLMISLRPARACVRRVRSG